MNNKDKISHPNRLRPEELPSFPLPQRPSHAHKGDFGRVLIVGGGPGMPGAVVLAAQAALRAGAGLLTVATWPAHLPALCSHCPETLVYAMDHPSELLPLLKEATVCVLGPGLGTDEWGKALFDIAMNFEKSMIVDASALRLLAQNKRASDRWILTPHPGEAAALLGKTTEDIQKQRARAVASIQASYGGVTVLKGHGTLINDGKKTWICEQGNPGMATPGMGDVLSGIIAGLIAQGLSLIEAAKIGVWVHAKAGDKVAEQLGERGLLASDLCGQIPKILNGLAS